MIRVGFANLREWRVYLAHAAWGRWQDLKAICEANKHLFGRDDRDYIRWHADEEWVRVHEYLRRELIIHQIKYHHRLPPNPDYDDRAAHAMRRVFAPAHLMPPRRAR